MISSIRINQTVIKAHITSATRKTVISISSKNRVKAFVIGKQGPKGADGATFHPTTATRFTSFIGDGIIEAEISDAPVALPLLPVLNRTIERGMANWWNGRIRPEAAGDAFRIGVTVLARPVNPVSIPILICEISINANGDPARIIRAARQSVTGGAFQELSFTFEVFAGATMLANGGRISLRSFGGSTIIKDPRLLIKEG